MPRQATHTNLHQLAAVTNKKNDDKNALRCIAAKLSLPACKNIVKAFIAATIFSMPGMDITAFSALLAGVGLPIGTALNGSLSNFAGGVMLLIFKPFKLGGLIEAQGRSGIVTELGIFNTVILSSAHRTIILANGPLSTGIIINHTAHGSLRVDTVLAIDGAWDIDRGRKIAVDAMLALPKVLKAPAPEVHVLEAGDGTTILAERPYAVQRDYWDVFFQTQENIKKAWNAAGIQPALSTTAQVCVTKGGDCIIYS